MGSSEEYLDNLLKSLTEGGIDIDELASDAMSIPETEETEPGSHTAGEHNKAMDMDQIEAMFASMGEGAAADEPSADTAVLEEDSLLGEAAADENMFADEPMLGQTELSDGLGLEEDSLPEELELDESLFSDDLSLDEESFPDDLSLDESSLSDELTLSEDDFSDELALDEDSLPDELVLDEDSFPDELALDEDSLPDELDLDEASLPDELNLDEMMLEEESLTEEPSLDEGVLADSVESEDEALDDFALDESMLMEEPERDEELPDDLNLDEESVVDDFVLEESGEEEFPDDLALDDLSLDGFEQSENDDDGLSEEDIDHLLGDDLMSDGDMDSEGDSLDDFVLEESGEDDADLSALLAGMGDDSDLSEINDLLEKSDQGVAVDDDMLAMLGAVSDNAGDGSLEFFSETDSLGSGAEDIREITPEELAERENAKRSKKDRKKEEKERKKKEKMAQKAAKKAAKKKGGADQDAEAGSEDALSGLLGDTQEAAEEPKKQGFFARLLAFLLEEDEDEAGDEDGDLDDDGLALGGVSDENKELLAELKAEDKKGGKKQKKDKKKGKKGKKKGGEGEDEGEGEEENAKPKKPKKEKKKKKEKVVDEGPKVPEKKLSRKKVMSVFMFCATIAACIIIIAMLLPNQMEKQEARVAYDHNQYEQVYDLLYGKKLNEKDEILLQKSDTILQVQRKLDSYENYQKMDMPLEALNALIEGVRRYQNLLEAAEQYLVRNEIDVIYEQILAKLSENYGLSEDDVIDIILLEDDVTYSQRLQEIVFGTSVNGEDEEQSEIKQDVLPEEEEIIDRLQGTDETVETEDADIQQAEEELAGE